MFIDGTALNIAMPALQADMHLTSVQLLWMVNAYSLFLSALLLIVGAILATIGLAGISYGFIESANKGFGDTIIVISLVIGGLSSVVFILSQHFEKYPMIASLVICANQELVIYFITCGTRSKSKCNYH